ncbi:hypothetical protein AKJ40_03340 [candidate division MSBL1 archaeon SCGC-AAA259M10]|uniref:Radical SAM core domain-containing protein n=1 Tax=candidate division MSBL1 archaeon SCGC-AAA259M10 TaxID=1698270 RepID=A0A133UYV6_9EURY|nr:hypothetical protein AKJ40_03340 [candidate division MSBL1 archaeon SCGC-AAA259M10]
MGKDRGLYITEIDFLLTYRCLKECDHCFVWGGPSATGTFNLEDLYTLIGEGEELGTVKTIYFEGGEPFLYYPVLLAGLKRAKECGFEVGVVSDAYWATSREDAEEWLRPIASIGVSDLSLSCDRYHGKELEVEEVSLVLNPSTFSTLLRPEERSVHYDCYPEALI